jgi:hypothetical protein
VGQRLSLIESSTPRSTSADSTLPVFRIRPQVMDTSFLAPDVARAARDGYETKFLSAVGFGSVRPFAGHHVWAEVPRQIVDEDRRLHRRFRSGRIGTKQASFLDGHLGIMVDEML